MTASYRVNSDNAADRIAIGPTEAPNDVMRWFSAVAKAGILVSNTSSTTPFTATFDRYNVA